MPHVVYVANSFVNKGIKEGCPLTLGRALKLLYVAYGYHLVLTGNRFRCARFCTHKYGPVSLIVFNRLKKCVDDNQVINDYVGPTEIWINKEHPILDAVWYRYGQKDIWGLAELTNNAKSPWARAKDEGKAFIPDKYTIEFFEQEISQRSLSILLAEAEANE